MKDVVAHFKKLNGEEGWGEWEVDQVERKLSFFIFFADQVILSNAILRPDRQLCSLSKRNQLWTRWEASDLNFLLILDGNTRHPIFKAENTTS